MNPIERLKEAITKAFPLAAAILSAPLYPEGAWFLDISFEGKHFVVEWSLATDFGISSLGNESYGERPDETYDSLDDVQRRITELLTRNEQSIPAIGVLLGRLRELRGCTQEEIASKLGVRQATVSGMERRRDIQCSTLLKVVSALGGSLEIFAEFSDAKFRLLPGWTNAPSGTRHISAEGDCVEFTVMPAEVQAFDDKIRFPALESSGCLPRAISIGDHIRSRHMVLEMSD